MGPTLHRAGLLTLADETAFMIYCIEAGLYQEAMAFLDTHPNTGDESTTKRRALYVDIRNSALRRMLETGAGFYLTAASREERSPDFDGRAPSLEELGAENQRLLAELRRRAAGEEED